MSSIVISGDTSGAITVTVPAVAGTNTVTIPAAAGTMMVSGNMPAFSAYANANQSVSTGTNTKVQINTLESAFPNNGYDQTTNYRFTPTVAGYYQVNANIDLNAGVAYATTFIFKNGSVYKSGASGITSNSNNVGISCLVYLNGSTDYIELYFNQASGSTQQINLGSQNTWFQAAMIRGA